MFFSYHFLSRCNSLQGKTDLRVTYTMQNSVYSLVSATVGQSSNIYLKHSYCTGNFGIEDFPAVGLFLKFVENSSGSNSKRIYMKYLSKIEKSILYVTFDISHSSFHFDLVRRFLFGWRGKNVANTHLPSFNHRHLIKSGKLNEIPNEIRTHHVVAYLMWNRAWAHLCYQFGSSIYFRDREHGFSERTLTEYQKSIKSP